ncbi:hypothetical protein JL_157 [Bacillus phage JL]|uniref:Uncharacterized protein n=1 Tax=Bacillus phage JL TaxID=1296655 RepID=S5M8I8_9CAUD|nr:hypothetical protein AVV47_gp139 [Bacillus phage JL]AGR46828.1 hypothetical protein JL_157 [Bacillus phage JL]
MPLLPANTEEYSCDGLGKSKFRGWLSMEEKKALGERIFDFSIRGLIVLYFIKAAVEVFG